MRRVMIAGAVGLAVLILAMPIGRPLANAPVVAATAEEIARALRGKVCTTRTGATFTFGFFGDYAYDGLWKSGGAYVIGEGIVTVTLDNGLERSFAISWHGNTLYMDGTALRCPTSAPAA